MERRVRSQTQFAINQRFVPRFFLGMHIKYTLLITIGIKSWCQQHFSKEFKSLELMQTQCYVTSIHAISRNQDSQIDHSPKHSHDIVHINYHIHTIGFPKHVFNYPAKFEKQNIYLSKVSTRKGMFEGKAQNF